MTKNFWETKHLSLRGVEPDDWEVHYHWDMDAEMMRNLDELHFPKSKKRAQKWADEAALKAPDGDDFHVEIELKESQQVIGVISSHHCDRRNGTFMFGIAIRPEFQRKGYATEAVLLLMRYFFDELRYQKCHVDIHGWNTGSIRLFEKLGFIIEGQIRRAIYTRGKHYDRMIYGMTIEEFRERYD